MVTLGGGRVLEPVTRPRRRRDVDSVARLRALPMRLEGDRAVSLGAHVSHQLGRAARADILALIPLGEGTFDAGTTIHAIPLH